MTKLTMALVEDALRGITLAGLPAPHRCRALLEIASLRFSIEIDRLGVHLLQDVGVNASWDFSFVLSPAEWELYCAPVPPRGFTSQGAIVSTQGAARIGGDRASWARAAIVLDRVFAALRRAQVGERLPTAPVPDVRLGVSPIEGRYVTLRIGDEVRRIYFEASGDGYPVVFLHTAGSDSRQYRHLLEDPALGARYRMYAFDMPWHGRSDPPDDWEEQRYALTTQTYADTVLAFVAALKLVKPILVGCSIGGGICLYLASRSGDSFAGICALEGGLGNPGRFIDWTNRLDIDHSAFMVSWERGLIAPASPSGPRAQTLWHYAQGGPGVYQGDTHFYSIDLPAKAATLGPATCPLFVFSGEYDYSATVEMSRAAAEQLGGELIVMDGRGHFPMSEDPISCRDYLSPVLDSIVRRQQADA